MKTFKLYTKDEGCQKLDIDNHWDVSALIDIVNEENIDILNYCFTIQELNEAIEVFMQANDYKDIDPSIEWDGPGIYVAWAWELETDYRVVSAEKCLDEEYNYFFESFQTAYLDYEITKSKPTAIEKFYIEQAKNVNWSNFLMGCQLWSINFDEKSKLDVEWSTLRKQLNKDGFYTKWAIKDKILCFSENKDLLSEVL
jgi:hypothetical protein